MSTDKESACQYEGCGRKTARDGMCIFHLPNKKPDEAKDFNSSLPAEIERMRKDATLNTIDLSGFRFPAQGYKFPTGTRFEKAINLVGAVFEGNVDFSDCEFSSDALFDRAEFSDKAIFIRSKFLGVASFLESEFLGDATFRGSQFSEGASFDNARFLGDADFFFAKFSLYAFFAKTKISGEAFFGGVEFSGGALFSESQFLSIAFFFRTKFSTAIFERAKFQSDANLAESEFSGEVAFFNCEFSGTVMFDRSRVTGLVRFATTTFQTSNDKILSWPIKQYTSFEGIRVDTSGEVRFEGGICMSRVSLHYADIRRFSFFDVKWGRLGGRASIMEHGILEERKRRSNGEEKPLPDITPEHVHQIYVGLRRNLERSAGRYPEAGDFFINEKEMRKLILQQGRRWPPIRNLPEWFILKVYGWLALYGESIARPVAWSLATVVVFALLKMFSFNLQLIDFSFNLQMIFKLTKLFPNFLMESVMAFFQMRSEPGLDILERLISVPILGSLFIALKRKFERR